MGCVSSIRHCGGLTGGRPFLVEAKSEGSGVNHDKWAHYTSARHTILCNRDVDPGVGPFYALLGIFVTTEEAARTAVSAAEARDVQLFCDALRLSDGGEERDDCLCGEENEESS